MLNMLNEIIKRNITEMMGKKIDITNRELEEAMDQVGRDLVYNYLIFKRDVTYETFIENLAIYLSINSKNG